MADQPAGWYPDPTGEAAQRYWDGAAWTDHVEGAPSSGFPPPPPPAPGSVPPPAPGYAQPASRYTRASQAGVALGLSIVGLLCCGPVSIAGLLMGRADLQAIDRGETDPGQRGLANSAYIVGIIGVVLWIIFAALWLILLATGSST